MFKTKNLEKALQLSFIFTSTFLVIELILAWYSQSLALLSDALHMLTDVVALGISMFAVRFAKTPADHNHTFGHQRIEVLSGLINSILLFVIAIFMVYQGANRFFNPVAINTNALAITAFAGLLINLICVQLLKHHIQNIAVKSAYNEALADLMSSAALCITSFIMLWFKIDILDSLIAIAIGIWALPRSYRLLKECVHILMEGAPTHIKIEEIAEKLLSVEGVFNVHDIHVWTLTQEHISLTAHLVHDKDIESARVIENAQIVLRAMGIVHTTFQCEWQACDHSDYACYSKKTIHNKIINN